MNDFKGIIEDVEKSSLVSDKVIKRVVEIIGQEKWQDIHDEESDICTTTGELIITLKGIPELETENNKLLDVINNQDVKIADLEKENKKLDRALITSTKNNIERQKIIDSLQAEKEKEKMQIIANCSDREEGLRRKIFKLEQQIEKIKEKHKQSELGLVISNSSARVELNEKIEELEQKLEQTEKDLADYQFNYPSIKELEKENAELKGLKDVVTLIRANNDTSVTLMQLNNKLVSKNQQLAIAKDLIHQFLIQNPISDWLPKKAEQFLKEIEK